MKDTAQMIYGFGYFLVLIGAVSFLCTVALFQWGVFDAKDQSVTLTVGATVVTLGAVLGLVGIILEAVGSK